MIIMSNEEISKALNDYFEEQEKKMSYRELNELRVTKVKDVNDTYSNNSFVATVELSNGKERKVEFLKKDNSNEYYIYHFF